MELGEIKKNRFIIIIHTGYLDQKNFIYGNMEQSVLCNLALFIKALEKFWGVSACPCYCMPVNHVLRIPSSAGLNCFLISNDLWFDPVS